MSSEAHMRSVLSRIRQGKSMPNQRFAIILAHHSPQREWGGPSQSKGALLSATASVAVLAAGLSDCASSMVTSRFFWPAPTKAPAVRLAASRSLTWAFCAMSTCS